MTKLYAPKQIVKRNKGVECQLLQDMMDPDMQKNVGRYDKVHGFCSSYRSWSLAAGLINSDLLST